MANIFKIKKYSIVTFCMVLFSLTSFAQDKTTATNGFDEVRVSALLKSRGTADKDLNREINQAREQYTAMKKNQAAIAAKMQLQKTNLKSVKKTSVNRTATTIVVDEEIPQSEKDALWAIYTSTNGANWTNNSGWDYNTRVTSYDGNSGWYGVEIIDGHVANLVLSGNGLTGKLPAEIGNLTELLYLELSWNSIKDAIPSSLFNLTKLESIWAQVNQFNGNIPDNIGNLSSVGQLILSDNKLTGQIPASISSLSNLNYLGLEQNRLSKAIPDLSSLPLLYALQIHSNSFTFSDFINQYDYYRNNLSLFDYSMQSHTDEEEIINLNTGNEISLTMFRDGGSTDQDTYQWYKDSLEIPNAKSRIYKIDHAQASDAGSYYCIANNGIITDLTLYRNSIQLNIASSNCPPIAAAITSSLEEFCSEKESTFSIMPSNNDLTYNWSVLTSANGLVNSLDDDTTGGYKYIFTNPGSYIIKAEIIDAQGCTTTLTKSINVVECELEITCVDQPINISFETTAASVNYNWYTIKEGNTQHLNPITNTTGLYTFTPKVSGTYTIYLNASQTKDCSFEFHKTIKVEACEPFVSCTKSNRNSPAIKAIFTTLLNKLISLPAATITNGYTSSELTALAFYIKDENPAIYNFVHDTQQGFIAFSFSDHPEYDVKIATNGNVVADFNLDNYESDNIVTELRGDTNDSFDSFTNHIDFCSALYCTSHIAFVVDESGSIDDIEAGKIKKQLKKYIQQQADDNDKLKSEVYVSLIGMADGDAKTRTDHVLQIKPTNDPIELKKFNNWIDNYGKRGVSASSDYWKSGLDVALNSAMKPSIVIMITDGCETSNVEDLRTTMSRFNNSKSTSDTSTDKPHLYVMGIENGFYVDGGLAASSLARSEDPNYVVQALAVESAESRVVPKLTTSLKYLLSFPETGYPQANIDNFRDYDYFGYDNFDSLGTLENQAFLSDNLKLSGFSCGTPTDKNYCSDCLSFQPLLNKEYMLSAWVKEESIIQVKTYENAVINIVYYSDVDTSELHRIATQKLMPSGDIIDGWQRIVGKFLIPQNTKTIGVELENNSNGTSVYFDDLRIHPLEGSIKTFVYDSETYKLMSELDENNYSTFYEYDNEGGLIRVKKETSKGVKTIQETRSGNFINTTQN
jgi:hypothetical protein